MTVLLHNHCMLAVIGVYSGREDNIFWRRIEDKENRIEAAGARSVAKGEVLSLGADIIHSVTNPVERLTGALHVYGGDYFAAGRSEWDPEKLRERPFDQEAAFRLFEEANAARPAAD